MQITLTAKGLDSKVELARVQVDSDGRWRYSSRAVEQAEGRLSAADLAQFQAFYDKVNWELEVLNGPVTADDRILFEMEVIHDEGDRRLYQFTEDLAHRSWQFRDLVHFLRHNVAGAGDPVGYSPDRPGEHPPTPM
ncbi:MAG: hypothetical protein ACOY93_16255 [Bacillota bacterium]